MTVSHRYRNFGSQKKSSEPAEDPSLLALEDHKLQAFEAGYQAGWDDAVKAKSEEKDKLSAELSQNLQEMNFTYHEALSKLSVSMQPVIDEIIQKLLPELLKNTLGMRIREQIVELIDDQANNPVEIVVAPQNVELVKEVAGNGLKEPFVVVGEETLGAGQAFVRIGNNERQIDLDGVVSGLSEAMEGFFHEAEKGAQK